MTTNKPEVVGFATHHDEPMLFPSKREAAMYCDEGEEPVALIRLSDYEALQAEQVPDAIQLLQRVSASTTDKPDHWAVMSPGRADQYRAESVAVRKELGFSADSDEVAPIDLLNAIRQIRADGSRITEQDAREIIGALVGHIERNTCLHEETHRGGVIWEICNSCGAKWADDRGGKPEFKWPSYIDDARTLLNKLNADREQVPAVAVPDGWKLVPAEVDRDTALSMIMEAAKANGLSTEHKPTEQEIENSWKFANAVLAAAPSHSQQSAESDLEIVQAALDKTGLELRVGKDWILVCGEDEYSGDDALEVYYKDWAALLTWAKQADTDRCPSHESEGEK